MSEAVEKINNMKDFLARTAWTQFFTTTSIATYIGLQLAPTKYNPDVVIAGLPIYHVQREGHAASDEILKYRSMGTIFLAHQKGGKRTYKCTLKIQGPARLVVLGFLQALQKNGIEQDVELSEYNFIEAVSKDSPSEDTFISPTVNSKIRYIQNYENIGKEQIAFHKTVPIITDTKIYQNMYLETLRYTEDVKIGIDTMIIDCAFREFIPPLHVRWYKAKNKTERSYFTTWISDDERDALRRWDLFINTFWGLRNILDDLYDPTVETKQLGQYGIELGVLTFGVALGLATIWRK